MKLLVIKSFFYVLPTTVGSKSTITVLGTILPFSASLKNVPKQLLSVGHTVVSAGMVPSGWIPCSRQYNSHVELPIWTPA